MKKYMFTEDQIKRMVDNVISEQSDVQTTIAAVQCFLNQVINAKLFIDGKSGPNSQTEQALKNFQMKKNKIGNNIEVDGVWGYKTQQTLTPEEAKIWDLCRNKYNLIKEQVNENIKFGEHEYEIFKLGIGSVKAGKDGILGDNNILIPWNIVIKLLKKFKR